VSSWRTTSIGPRIRSATLRWPAGARPLVGRTFSKAGSSGFPKAWSRACQRFARHADPAGDWARYRFPVMADLVRREWAEQRQWPML
jgi:hypothetical protein